MSFLQGHPTESGAPSVKQYGDSNALEHVPGAEHLPGDCDVSCMLIEKAWIKISHALSKLLECMCHAMCMWVLCTTHASSVCISQEWFWYWS